MKLWVIALLAQLPLIPAAEAQTPAKPKAEATATLPAGVTVHKRKTGSYYASKRGMTLYALNMRLAFPRSSGVRDQPWCQQECQQHWTALTAPKGAQPIGDWKVIDGATGPQWSYRNNPVFTYKGDRKPGDLNGDTIDDLWNVIVHLPAPPVLAAPAPVTPKLLEGAWYLADAEGHALFVPAAAPAADWAPLAAGFAARNTGDWSVGRDGAQAHWLWRGKPVFVSQQAEPGTVPPEGQILRP